MKIEIKNLYVSVDEKELLRGINLNFQKGKTIAIMGPNGSGKTTLALALMGNPKYKITKGKIILDGKDITKKQADERAKLGLFLSFQNPKEIPGVNYGTLLRSISKRNKIDLFKHNSKLKEQMNELKIDESFKKRELNFGLSGGEKKKMELLQLQTINPKYAIFDEIDSGLDVDALKIISKNINKIKKNTGIMLITHYNRILKYIKPDKVYIMKDGKIIKSGTSKLAEQIEKKGFEF